MDDTVASTVGQRPLIVRVARAPAAPLLQIIAWPDILETGVIGDPWIQVLQIPASSILKGARHHIDTGFLRLNHRLGLGTVASCPGTPGDINDLQVNTRLL